MNNAVADRPDSPFSPDETSTAIGPVTRSSKFALGSRRSVPSALYETQHQCSPQDGSSSAQPGPVEASQQPASSSLLDRPDTDLSLPCFAVTPTRLPGWAKTACTQSKHFYRLPQAMTKQRSTQPPRTNLM